MKFIQIICFLDSIKTNIKVILKPEEIAGLNIAYNPLKKGRTSCDVKIDILDNPYEYFTVSLYLMMCLFYLIH